MDRNKDNLFKSAKFYHNEGLCVIPVVHGDKMPAIEWEEFHARCSTEAEIEHWWNNGHNTTFNIGIVHGGVSGNFISIDVDEDEGAFGEICALFPELVAGRIEQSGSGAGFHIPLRLEQLPDFGWNNRLDRPKGNRTWKLPFGNVNIRCRFCQTVVPPSLHPSGHRYRFLRKGPITAVANLDKFMAWLDAQVPDKPGKPFVPARTIQPAAENDLVAAVKGHWSTLKVFEFFGIVGQTQEDYGELRLLGNGGLLIAEDGETWYCFSDEFGGGVFEAWGWQRFGSAYDNKRQFRQVLLEMARAAGIDLAAFYKRGDERQIRTGEDERMWTGQNQTWREMR